MLRSRTHAHAHCLQEVRVSRLSLNTIRLSTGTSRVTAVRTNAVRSTVCWTLFRGRTQTLLRSYMYCTCLCLSCTMSTFFNRLMSFMVQLILASTCLLLFYKFLVVFREVSSSQSLPRMSDPGKNEIRRHVLVLPSIMLFNDYVPTTACTVLYYRGTSQLHCTCLQKQY